MTDPFDVLRAHVQSVALLERPNTDVDDLIAAITGASAPNIANRSERTERSERSNVIPLRPTGRRRWLVAAGVTTVVVLGGAGVAAYIGRAPEKSVGEVVCREAARAGSSALAVEMGSDPIRSCADLWSTGRLPLTASGGGDRSVPRLVACVGDLGLEVYPLDLGVACADIGLEDADVAAATSDPAAKFASDLQLLINSEECLPPDRARSIVEEALRDSEFSDWRVVSLDEGAACVWVSVEPSTPSVVIFPNPSPKTTQQESK